jgi:parallel beta-helix repeat protein
MYYGIDFSKIPVTPKISLHKPDGTKIANLTFSHNLIHKLNINALNELEFELPYLVELNHELVRNPYIDLMKFRYYIKLEVSHNTKFNEEGNEYEEWFIIDNPKDTADEERDYKIIHCYSRALELKDKQITSYKNYINGIQTPQNAEQILTALIKVCFEVDDINNALWSIGYINPIFNAVYRTFEISNKTFLDFIYSDLITTFKDSIVIFDTINRTISLYHNDDIGLDRGLLFSYGKYLNTLEHELDTNKFCTKYPVYGKDNLSIAEVNPTGKNYLLSFDPFIFPYSEEIPDSQNPNNYTVLVHSDYLSDELCHKLLQYNNLQNSKSGVLDNTESNTNSYQIQATSHGLSVGDYIVNRTNGSVYSEVTKIIDENTFYIGVKSIEEIIAYATTTNLKISNHGLNNGDYIINKTLGGLKIADIGTTDTLIKISTTGLTTSDYIINKNRNDSLNSARKQILEIIDETTLRVASITGQTAFDEIIIEKYRREITFIDFNTISVSPIDGQQLNDEIIIEKLTVTGQKSGDSIYKYNNSTIRFSLFEKTKLQNQLTILNNQLSNLQTNRLVLLDSIAVQSDPNVDIYYDFTTVYNGVPDFEFTIIRYNTGYKYLVTCKVSSADNLTISLNNVEKAVLSNTWTPLGKVDDLTRMEDLLKGKVSYSGTATGVDIHLLTVGISDEDFSAIGNEQQLVERYCIYELDSVIASKNAEISSKLSEISIVDLSINNIHSQLSLENNFTTDEIKTLQKFIITNSSFNNSNYIDVYDLYDSAIEQFALVNTPETVINIDIVNFLECVEEQHNWHKLNLGDIVTIKYDTFGVNLKAKIMSLEFDYEERNVQLTISNIKLLNDKNTVMRKFYNPLLESANTLKEKKINWDSMALNFNSNNDAIITIPADPMVANNGTAIDHTLNTDGSANISFEWSFDGTGDAYNIDGFSLYVRSTKSNIPYFFGSTIAREQYYPIESTKRAFILYGVPTNEYYTFGIQAYRKVRADIDSSGLLKSNIIKSTFVGENPYRPSANVAFEGNIVDSLGNSLSADQIVTNLNAMADDSKITKTERITVKQNVLKIAGSIPPSGIDSLTSGQTYQILQQADYVGILNTDMSITNFKTAYTNLITYLTNMPTTNGGTLNAWDVDPSNDEVIISIVTEDWDNYWNEYNNKYNLLNQSITEYTSKGDGTFIIGTFESGKRADYIIPEGSTSAQTVINQAINDLPKVLLCSNYCQGSLGTDKITLASTDIQPDDYYNYKFIEIIEGTGIGQIKNIWDYDNATNEITIRIDWDIQPDQTSKYLIYYRIGKIILLEGTYICDDCIIVESNINIEGQGNGTLIKLSDTLNLPSSLITTRYCTNNVNISNLALHGNSTINSCNTMGIYIVDVDNININNIQFYDFKNYSGVFIIRGTSINIEKCFFYDGLYSAIWLYTSTNDIKQIYISQNTMSNIQTGVSIVQSSYINITGNYITNCSYGIEVYESDNCLVSNNFCLNNKYDGITLSFSNNNIISNNHCEGSSQITDNTYSNITIKSTSSSNNIQNNICKLGSNTNQPKYGINVQTADCNNNLVTNNDLLNSGKTGSFNDAGVGTITIAGNRL